MTYPSIRRAAIDAAKRNPGVPQSTAARDMPAWATASLVWDVDGILLLEVMSWRPGRSCLEVMRHLSDQLAELGWTQLDPAGAMPWHRPDGVICPGLWSTWRER
jgi:hypothetical protein